MQLHHVGGPGGLVQSIDVLCDDHHLGNNLSSSAIAVAGVRLRLLDHAEAIVVPLPYERRIRQVPASVASIIGSYCVHSPSSASRNVGMPDSLDTPAPVSTTTRRHFATSARPIGFDLARSSPSEGVTRICTIIGWDASRCKPGRVCRA